MDAYLPLRDDLLLTGQASYVMELLDRFTYEDNLEHPTLFRLLTETLSCLASKSDLWLAIRYYEMRLLDELGFRPRLFECANCGREIIAEDQFFSFSAGGYLPNMRKRFAKSHEYIGGHAQVSASLPTFELWRSLTGAS